MHAGPIPALVELLGSLDTDIQYASISALCEFALDCKDTLPSILCSATGAYPLLDPSRKLMRSAPKLVPALVQFMDNSSPKLQCQALITLKYLAKDRESQLPPPEDILLISYRSA